MQTIILLEAYTTEGTRLLLPNPINNEEKPAFLQVTKSLVRRAEKAGFSALVLTVDAPYFGVRLADVRNKFELPSHLRMANFVGMGALEKKAGNSKGGSGINEYVASLFDPTLSWKDVEWLRSFTKLPIVLKGILRPDDAVKGIEAGASAIVVSNHGARQLDGVAATIDALPAIRAAVGNKCEVSTQQTKCWEELS